MKKISLFFLLIICFSKLSSQIVADHTIVDEYDFIPNFYLDSVKKMLVDIAGESHSLGYRVGLNLLELLNPKFDVETYEGNSPGISSDYLRFGSHDWIGEEDFYTSQDAIDDYKLKLNNQYNMQNPYTVIGFAWCWDMFLYNPPGGQKDPEYGVRWAGSSKGGPEGSLIWGLDKDDQALTGNSVCMDTYLSAVEQYITYSNNNNLGTRIIYTTGPVEGQVGNEAVYQRDIKHDYIRSHVQSDDSRILFDYADILAWNNQNEESIGVWDDEGTYRYHQYIHDDNMFDYDDSWNIVQHVEDGDHIGEVGALRLAKAMWWMLARIAGWDGTIDDEDTMPPSMPTGLTINSTTMNSISFSWNASSDNVAVAGYNLYRNGTLIGTTSENSYTDNTLTECDQYTYNVSAIDLAGNESQLSQGLLVSNCHPDLTPTLIVSPNISHGITVLNVLVRVTELNNVNSDGPITVIIPVDERYHLQEGYNLSLEILNDISLNNSDWSYARDETNHVFTSTAVIPAGGFSTFGFTIVFNPDTIRGFCNITSQVVVGSGGEMRGSNNIDSERLDYFQQ